MRGDLNDTGIDREFQWRHSAVPTFWALLIFGLHAIPGKDLPQASWLGEMHMDKLIHLMMFMFKLIAVVQEQVHGLGHSLLQQLFLVKHLVL